MDVNYSVYARIYLLYISSEQNDAASCLGFVPDMTRNVFGGTSGVDVRRCVLPYVHVRACGMRHASRRRTQCERGLRTTNDGTASVQMTVLEIMISVLHRLPNAWRAGRHV